MYSIEDKCGIGRKRCACATENDRRITHRITESVREEMENVVAINGQAFEEEDKSSN